MQLELRRPSFIGLLHAAAVLTLVFSVATLFDWLHRHLEMFSHFRLQYLGASLLLTLAFVLFRSRGWALLMLAVTAVNVWPVAHWYVAGSEIDKQTGSPLKLLLVNVYSGNDKSGALLDLIEAEQPDIIFVQEVTYRWAHIMNAVRSDYPYNHVLPQNDNFGIGVYAREAFVDAKTIDSPPYGFPTLVVNHAIGEQTVTLVSTHPVPPLGKIAYEARNRHLASIVNLLDAIDGPKVLIGDLNVSMWSHLYEKFETDTGLTNTRQGFGAIPTWPRQLPFGRIPIDHCLVSPHFAVLDTRRGPNVGSDHLPLIVDLVLL